MNASPRIQHWISRLDGYGSARTLSLLAAKQAARGQPVVVATFAAEPSIVDELKRAGIEVHVIRRRWQFDPLAIGRFVRWRRQHPAALVHAWDADALFFAWLTNRREPIVAAWEASPPAPHWVTRLTGIRSTTIPPAVIPPVSSRFDRKAALAELGLDHDARWIATAGSLVRAKELDEAIWCYELVRVLHPTARLVIFGDGPDRNRLERYASLVSEPGCVCFAGYRPDLAELLPHADVYWQLDPASHTSHALLEAMISGVPVVASDVPSHRAAITSGTTGMLVPSRNRADVARATDQLLSDPALAMRIGEAGVGAAAQAWSIDKALAACDDLYHARPPTAP